jgi:23S rRNA (uridine2552-2'-O)-methyltransferase
VKKSHSSKQWLRRHVSDPYVKRSKREGYRSRSAYKLIEIDARDRLFRPGQVVVDLGSAPGGWSQVAAKRVGGRGRRGRHRPAAHGGHSGRDVRAGGFHRRARPQGARGRARGPPGRPGPFGQAPNLTGIPFSDQARSMALAEIARDLPDYT